MSKPTWAERGRWGDRHYRFPGLEERKFPSVTTVIKVLAAPALERWKQDQIAQNAYDKRDGWVGEDRTTAIKVIKAYGEGAARRAADFGTEIHEMIEKGTSPTETDRIEAINYLVAAAERIPQLGKHWRSEITLLSLEHGFAGTADVLSFPDEAPGILRVSDWKTTKLGSTVGWDSHIMQLAGLSLCEHWADQDGTIHQLPAEILELSVIGLRPDATSVCRVIGDRYRIGRARGAFLALLEAHLWQQDNPRLEFWETGENDE